MRASKYAAFQTKCVGAMCCFSVNTKHSMNAGRHHGRRSLFLDKQWRPSFVWIFLFLRNGAVSCIARPPSKTLSPQRLYWHGSANHINSHSWSLWGFRTLGLRGHIGIWPLWLCGKSSSVKQARHNHNHQPLIAIGKVSLETGNGSEGITHSSTVVSSTRRDDTTQHSSVLTQRLQNPNSV